MFAKAWNPHLLLAGLWPSFCRSRWVRTRHWRRRMWCPCSHRWWTLLSISTTTTYCTGLTGHAWPFFEHVYFTASIEHVEGKTSLMWHNIASVQGSKDCQRVSDQGRDCEVGRLWDLQDPVSHMSRGQHGAGHSILHLSWDCEGN